MTNGLALNATGAAGSARACRLPLAAALALCFGQGCFAANIAVDDTTPGSVDGKCTIVDAVSALNTGIAVNACAAGDGDDDVIDLTGFTAATTISFTQPTAGFTHALALTKPATIKSALDADGAPLVTLQRDPAATQSLGLIQTTAALTVIGLKLANGSTPYGGGAVLSGDALIVSNSVVTGNSASGGGGLMSTALVTVDHSLISGNTAQISGGGVVSNTEVRIYSSTLTGNTVTSATGTGGGAVYSQGSALIAYSTIDGNSSMGRGGGVAAGGVTSVVTSTISSNQALGGNGGGVYSAKMGVSITRSTINNNTASAMGGGIYSADADLDNSTVSGNVAGTGSGGVFATTLTMSYTTVSGNSTQAGTGGGVNFGTYAMSTGSIMFGNSPDDLNSTSKAFLIGNFNVVGVAPWGLPDGTLRCDPLLQPLTDAGGPTKVMPLGQGSCALDAGSSAPSDTTDQRGEPRPAKGENSFHADLGAYERQSAEDADLVYASSFDPD